MRELHAVGVAGLLYLSAALALLPWSLSHRPDPVALQRTWRLVALGVVVGGAAGPALLTAGLVNTPAASASLLLNLELVATVAGVLLVWAQEQPGAGLDCGSSVQWGARRPSAGDLRRGTLIGADLSGVVLADPVELVQLVAMAVAVCGVGLSLRSIHRHQHEHPHVPDLHHRHEH